MEQAVCQVFEPQTPAAPNVLTADEKLAEQKARSYHNLKCRFQMAVGQAVGIMPLGMLMMWPALMARISMLVLNYGLLLLTLQFLLYSGRELYVSAWDGFKHRAVNMDTLITLALSSVYFPLPFLSVFQAFGQLSPARMRKARLAFSALDTIILNQVLKGSGPGPASAAPLLPRRNHQLLGEAAAA